MDHLEAEIATYLTIDGQVFISPQYDIKWDMDEGGTCPDFVALDFRCNEIVVVEVTAAANWKPLANLVQDREKRWFGPLRKRFIDTKVVTPAWRLRFLGFVREDIIKEIRSHFSNVSDVTFCSLEESIAPWKYWAFRKKNGLPGNGGKASPKTD